MVNITLKPATNIKFLCSYGGKILPRQSDGKLRYNGGHTRVLSVDRSVSFAELSVKLGEMVGTSVNLRCQLPAEDLDALVSITSDEDLFNLIEEYDQASSSPKIRAFLFSPKSIKQISPPRLNTSDHSFSSSIAKSPEPIVDKLHRRITPPLPVMFPVAHRFNKSGMTSKILHPHVHHYPYHAHGNSSYGHRQIYLVHHGNHWQ